MRKTPCAAFIYIRDNKIPSELIKTWEKMNRPFYEETVMMKYIDDLTDGWKGTEYYWENFEPDFFNLESNSAYSDKSRLEVKNICFKHFNVRSVNHLLHAIESGKKTTFEAFNQ